MRTTSAWLVCGVGLVGLTIGYMSGGSQTPVASVAIPVIFGLMATVFTVLQAKKATTGPKPRGLHAALARARDKGVRSAELNVIPNDYLHRSVGICLVVFSLGFLLGAHGGAYVRLHDVLRRPSQAPIFPWTAENQPPSVESALQWIVVQQRLRALGYSDEQIAVVFSIQQKEWSTRAELGSRAASSSNGFGVIETLKNLTPQEKASLFSISVLPCQKVNGVATPGCHLPINKGTLEELLAEQKKPGGIFLDIFPRPF